MFKSIIAYFKLFKDVPVRAVCKDGGYYFDRRGNICGTYDVEPCCEVITRHEGGKTITTWRRINSVIARHPKFKLKTMAVKR